MYRVSPFNYLVDGMLATGLANTRVACSSIELLELQPPSNQTCGQFMDNYIQSSGGYLVYPNAIQDCQFCSANDTNVVLKTLNASYSHRWRNFGIMWAYIIFNVAAALGLYWLARVPKKQKVLDSPPTELATRVQTRLSENAARRTEKSKTGGEKGIFPHDESSGSEEQIEKLDEGRKSAEFVTPFEDKADLFQSIVKDER